MNESYLANLTPFQRVLQARLIRQSQKKYEETGKVEDRPKVSEKPTPRSRHAIKFQDKYGFSVSDLSKVKSFFPDTDVDTILSKGRAAYASSGSRPNTTAEAWAKSRLASVLTGGKALRVDKDLVGEQSRKKINS